jgi:hypothetical protein
MDSDYPFGIGYAKLIVELNQEITEKITPSQVIENLKSLIGK